MNLQKMKRFLKSAAVTLVTAAMCFGAVSPVMAEPAIPEIQTLQITKNLQIADGVTTPNVGFEFTITPQDGEGTLASDAPLLVTDNKLTILYTETDEDGDRTDTDSSNENSSIQHKSAQINFSDKAWPHAGVYKYKIKEKANVYNITDPTKEKMTYDTSAYTLRVYVENENGNPTFRYATLEKDSEPGTKLDGTGLVFNNIYAKNTSPTDPNTNALAISKIVTGEYGDLTKAFTFTLSAVQLPALVDESVTYSGYIVTYDGTNYGEVGVEQQPEVTINANGTLQDNGIFQLTHGQALVFPTLPAGTTYTVAETKENDYTPAVTLKEGGIAISRKTTDNTDNLVVTGALVTDKDGNTVEYTNAYKTITSTGFLIDNMPFILLIVVGVAGIGAYMVSRRRHYQG